VNCINQEVTVGQRLARVGSAILPGRNRMEPPMNRDDYYSATHPSDHNSVYIIDKSGPKRDTRETEWGRRRGKEGERVGKGTRRSKNADLEERYLRGRAHEFPFSMPAPTTYGYGWPCVQPCHAAGCAAVCPYATPCFISWLMSHGSRVYLDVPNARTLFCDVVTLSAYNQPYVVQQGFL